MSIRISPFTRTYLLLSLIPAFVGGCLAAASRGWHSTLADVPLGRSDAVIGFAVVLSGPLSWYLPGSSRSPLFAALVTIVLLAMMIAHSVAGNSLGRALTRGGFVLWWLCGLVSLGALLFGRAA